MHVALLLRLERGSSADYCDAPAPKGESLLKVNWNALCRWLGNPTADKAEQSVLCWNDANSIYVITTDSCPCIQRDANTGAVTGTNPPCCGNIYHM